MGKTNFFILSIFIFMACSQTDNKDLSKSNLKTDIIDTIIELNSPKLLDLEEHQIFIDTTRNSKFYEEISGFKIDKEAINELKFLFDGYEKYKPFNSKEIDIPDQWIRIRKMQNRFVAYNPVNGSDWTFKLMDSIIIYYAMEPTADVILDIEKKTERTHIFKLAPNPNYSDSKITYLKIRRCDNPLLYTYSFSDDLTKIDRTGLQLITPIENLKNFDLLVEHSPRKLIVSKIKFDKISLDDLN